MIFSRIAWYYGDTYIVSLLLYSDASGSCYDRHDYKYWSVNDHASLKRWVNAISDAPILAFTDILIILYQQVSADTDNRSDTVGYRLCLYHLVKSFGH